VRVCSQTCAATVNPVKFIAALLESLKISGIVWSDLRWSVKLYMPGSIAIIKF